MLKLPNDRISKPQLLQNIRKQFGREKRDTAVLQVTPNSLEPRRESLNKPFLLIVYASRKLSDPMKEKVKKKFLLKKKRPASEVRARRKRALSDIISISEKTRGGGEKARVQRGRRLKKESSLCGIITGV